MSRRALSVAVAERRACGLTFFSTRGPGRWRDAYAATFPVPGRVAPRRAAPAGRRGVRARRAFARRRRGARVAAAERRPAGRRRARAGDARDSVDRPRAFPCLAVPVPTPSKASKAVLKTDGPSPVASYALRVARGEMREAARAARDEATPERVVAPRRRRAARARGVLGRLRRRGGRRTLRQLERAAVAATTRWRLRLSGRRARFWRR